MRLTGILVGAALVAATLSGCGGSSHDSGSPVSMSSSSSGAGASSSSSGSSTSSSSGSGMTASMVSTQDVLALAKMPSDTALPFEVDAGYTFTDTSEITQPISVQ
jgi:hypothetical protein